MTEDTTAGTGLKKGTKTATGRKDLIETIEIPEGVTITNEDGLFVVKGKKGEARRALGNPKITASIENNTVTFRTMKGTKRQKTLMGTFAAHLRNMMRGAAEGHSYRLRICSGHFPMNVSVANNQLVVKNFIGEKVPRTTPLLSGTTVKVDGQDIIVEANEKERAGQMAADIEQLTRRPGFDRRIFMDGIYITEKDGKPVRR